MQLHPKFYATISIVFWVHVFRVPDTSPHFPDYSQNLNNAVLSGICTCPTLQDSVTGTLP